MSEVVLLAVDSGTKNTGYAKLYETGGEVLILDLGMTTPRSAEAKARINGIVSEVCMKVEAEPHATELWVEMFTPYGARKGAVWNSMLVGALLYMPVTRDWGWLASFGIYAQQWKAWIRRETNKLIPEDMLGMVLQVCEDKGITVQDQHHEALSKSPHVTDALGIGLFAIYGVEDTKDEYETSPAEDE